MKQLLLDEHIPLLYRVQLRSRNPDLTVWAIGDVGAPGKGTLDPDLLQWCEAFDFVLVTNNRQSMPRHLADHLAAGHHVPGILTLNLDEPVGEILDDLLLIVEVAGPDELRDRIEYVPLR